MMSGEDESQVAPLQFSLADLFALITVSSVAALLFAWHGVATITIAVGLMLAFANARGWFVRLQRPKFQWASNTSAWLLFGVSLFLPTVEGCQGRVMVGHEVAQAAAVSEYQLVAGLLGVKQFAEQEDETQEESIEFQDCLFLLLLTGWNVGNGLLVILPVNFFFWKRGQARWLWLVFLACCVATWVAPRGLIGRYVWFSSFAVVMTSYRIRWREFLGMALLIGALAGTGYLVEYLKMQS